MGQSLPEFRLCCFSAFGQVLLHQVEQGGVVLRAVSTDNKLQNSTEIWQVWIVGVFFVVLVFFSVLKTYVE